jgi:elongation factor Ts
MHIAASNPLAIDKTDIDKKIVDKEMEIIKAEIVNSGKPKEMVEKISNGKISKFLSDNSLLNQIWIMDPKKRVSDILKENSSSKTIRVVDFVRYKVGEGV